MVRRIALTLLVVFAAGCSPSRTAPEPQATSPSTSTSLVPSPVASASGWLAYQSGGAGGTDGVFLVRTDGSDDHEIVTKVPGERLHPDFSRDGKRLAFDQLASDDVPNQVYVAGADGSRARIVAKCRPPKCAYQWEPAWSPDGKLLAVSSGRGFQPAGPPQRFGITIIDVAKGTQRTVVDNAFQLGENHFPRWSPDGRRLVFWRDREATGEGAVFVVNVDGSGLRQLTKWKMWAGDPDWSPNRELIVFGTRPLSNFPESGQSELYTIRPNGTGLRRLTNYGPNGPRATQPRWTPDGKAILYTRTTQNGFPRHIYAISADGTGDTPVLTTKQIYTHPILQPTP